MLLSRPVATVVGEPTVATPPVTESDATWTSPVRVFDETGVVSRAHAIIVRSALLTDYLPATPDRLVELGAFLSLASCDTPTE